MAARKLTVYKEFAAQLVKFEEEYGGIVVDCSTTGGLKSAKDCRKEIRDTRSNLEDLRKEIKAPALAKCKQIDDEAKDIKVRLDTLFNFFDGEIKAIENKAAIAKQKKLDEAAAKLQELDKREAAIKAKEIELGLRDPDHEDNAGDVSGTVDDSPVADSGDSPDSSTTVANASIICEPHIKAASERLASLRKIRNLVEPTDAQPTGDIDEVIARNHDEVLAEVWEVVDGY